MISYTGLETEDSSSGRRLYLQLR